MNPFVTLKNYLFESYEEMKKVTWPTKNQTINYSLLVVGMSVGMAAFFILLDAGLKLAIAKILPL